MIDVEKPSGINIASRPRKKAYVILKSSLLSWNEYEKNAGSRTAEHGDNRARKPPKNARKNDILIPLSTGFTGNNSAPE